jgi:hypothetical protein
MIAERLTSCKGAPSSQSLEKITKSARLAAGKKGGVTRIAYLTAIVPKVGDNLVTTIAGGAPAMDIDEVSFVSVLFHLSY